MNTDKFVFFDIDGTIYSKRYQIPDSTREAIDKLKRNGHHPVVCTGRTRIMIFDAIAELDFDGYICGIGTYGEWKGQELFRDGLCTEDTAELIETFLAYGFNPYMEGTEHMYYLPEQTKDPEKEIKRIFSLEDQRILRPYQGDSGDVLKISGAFRENSDEKGFRDAVRGRYHAINHFNVLLETFPAGKSKGDGIRKMIERLGGDMQNTYAFGDSFNDLEMLEEVRYGICMENGDPKLLSRIPLHAKRMEEDGIYHSLKEFGLI